MKKIMVILFCSFFSVVCFGQQIPAGSTVYVAPMHGYEAYVIAALQKKHVPVVIILDRHRADYIIGGVIEHRNMGEGQPVVVVNNTNNVNSNETGMQRSFERGQQEAETAIAAKRALGETSVSISVFNPKTTAIVFSYTTGKVGNRQLQRNAEDFAKHLKKFIEKGKR